MTKWQFWRSALFALIAACGTLSAADDAAMKSRVEELWAAEDYAGLEKIAAECRADSMDLLDASPRISNFYAAIRGPGVPSKDAFLKTLLRMENWFHQFPDSVTARVAMADIYLTEAWKAQGNGAAIGVKPAGWMTYEERMQSAKSLLRGPAMSIDREPPIGPKVEIQVDPTIADLRIVLAISSSPQDERGMMSAFDEAKKFWPGYYPVYENVALALLPRWGGDKGAVARFADTEANKYPGTEGDGLYALLAAMVLETEGVEEFPAAGFDVKRFLRGLDVLASRGEQIDRHLPRQRAAYIEATFGDPTKARERIFTCGPNVIPLAYGTRERIAPAWEKCGAMEELRKGIELEKAGKLREALALYGALSSGVPNPWVSSFALRNGVWNLWSVNFGTPVTGLPLDKADGNQIFEMAGRAICAADLDAACDYAKAFDRERPQNITGKYILVTAAALRGDQAAFDAEKARFLEMKTNRQAYQIAQQYASGQLKWETAKEQLPRDENFVQACSMMGAIALGDGRKSEAREIFLAVHQELPFQEAVAFPESMLWGSLARKYPERLGE